jgi:pimeloyl-ACP methyl ester carboxylesterase
MRRLRPWLMAASIAFALLLAAGAGLWLVYGESVRVLAGLVNASGEPLPPGVTRQPLLLLSGDATVQADIYEPAEPRAVLLFVPGLTSAGKSDSRVVGVSGVLAGAGFRVVTPDLPGAMALSAGREDSAVLRLLLDHLVAEQAENGLPLGVVAVSYGLAPALAAAAAPERAQGIAMVLGLGGYFDGAAVVSYATTGWFTDPRDGITRMGHPDSRARWLLLYSLLEHVPSALDRNRLAELARVGAAGGAPGLVATTQAMAQGGPDARAILGLIANTEPERVDTLIEALPPKAHDDLTALSPSRLDLAALAGRIVLVHGETDPVIPFSESLRLADAVPGSRVFLIPGFSHVAPEETGTMGHVAMIQAVRVLLSLRR